MEKVKSNLPLCLLLLCVLKTLFLTPSIQEAAVVLGLIGAVILFKKIESASSVDKFQEQIKSLEDSLNKLTTDFKAIQSALHSTKLINTIRTFGGTERK